MSEPVCAGDIDERVFLEVLAETVETLDEEGLPYVLIGGIASAVLGRPRWTHDIDVFVKPEDARRVLEVLAERGFGVEETFADWLFKGFKKEVLVDVIFRVYKIYLDDEMISRAVMAEFKGRRVRIVPPEDLLVMKALVADEHMPRHWHDALGLVGSCPLDWDYVERRAKQYAARRVLSLLVYADSSDIVVPARPVHRLFEAIYGGPPVSDV